MGGSASRERRALSAWLRFHEVSGRMDQHSRVVNEQGRNGRCYHFAIQEGAAGDP